MLRRRSSFMDRIWPLASPPPPARLFFLPDAAHAWREEVDGTTARLGVQHLSNAYFRKSLEDRRGPRLSDIAARRTPSFNPMSAEAEILPSTPLKLSSK